MKRITWMLLGCALCTFLPESIEAKALAENQLQQISDLAVKNDFSKKLPATSPCYAPGRPEISWTVKLPEGASVKNWYIYSDEFENFRGATMNGETKYPVIPGKYYFYFMAENPQNFARYIYVSDLIDIQQDMEMEFDLTECTNKIHMTNYFPDGTLAMPVTWNEDGTSKVYEGNTETEYVEVGIFRKGHRLNVGDMTSGMLRVDLGFTQWELGLGFYINSIPEDYEIALLRSFYSKGDRIRHVLYNTLPASEIKPQTEIRTDWTKYIKMDAVHSPIADVPLKMDDVYYRFTALALREGHISDMFGVGSTSADSSPYVWVCSDKNPDTSTELLFSYGNVQANSFDPNSGEQMFYPINSLPVTFPEPGKARFNAYLSDHLLSEYNFMSKEGGLDFFLFKNFTAHPRFSWDYDPENIPVFGNSVPIMVSNNVWIEETNWSQFRPYYYGRYGEYREPDLYCGWSEVTIDGEKVFEGSTSGIMDWSNLEYSLPIYKGLYTYTIENDCALVDGREGLNRTVITFDASKEDREAPTLTMLNFRNAEDVITDRFEKGADCTMEFSAADLSSQINELEYDWFSVRRPATVKVEYAAENGEHYQELEVTEDPDLYFEPCFGAFYRVNFADASVPSENGWFKLRITLVDESGNTQQQIISPALYIAELTGTDSVDEVTESSLTLHGNRLTGEGEIVVYDLNGRVVLRGENTLYVGDLTGVYVAGCQGSKIKVIL